LIIVAIFDELNSNRTIALAIINRTDLMRAMLFLILGFTFGCSSAANVNVTQSQLDQVKNGMSETEVLELLGEDFTVIMELDLGKNPSRTLQWSNSDESVAVVGFVNGKVENKSSSMLPK
tara:strand:+ start:94 stop:453 length:360 start_codon:yes stop_codon:yes gene_type:complete